jgi:hypothetical protein
MEVVAHLYIDNIQDQKAESDYKMNANLHLERWRIGKRIESGGYLGNKFTVAESLVELCGVVELASPQKDGWGNPDIT